MTQLTTCLWFDQNGREAAEYYVKTFPNSRMLINDGGQASQCGWLKDKFGVSWQVVPSDMGNYLGGPDAAGRARATQAMLQMQKLDLDALRTAYLGE